MKRHVSFAIASICLIVAGSSLAKAGTDFKTTSIKVVQQWIMPQTDLKLTEAPGNIVDDKANNIRYGTLDNEEAFAKLWKAWRDDAAPKVDFSKQFVLVLCAPENAKVEFRAFLDRSRNLQISSMSTERAPNGMTYVIAVIDRAGIKSINGKSFIPLR